MEKRHEDFIKSNFDQMSVESLRKLFNDTFGTDYKSGAFYYHTQRLGLRKHVEHKYTEEEDTFLRENASRMTRAELMELFNEKFGASVKYDAIMMRCWQKGYGRQSDGQFHKGSRPWDKTEGGREEYIKTIKGGNSRSFRKGIIPHNTKPVGSESVWSGVVRVKTEHGWKQKTHLIWQMYHGCVPAGHKIIFADNNPDNFEPSNLRCIDNKTMTILISNRWHEGGAVIVDTAIAYARLKKLLEGDNK